ncbi:MAG: 50S ribosomal protein L10 [Pseudomonadota bacterium]|nr:50S ribosomal protein L10 [Pseudomonadota bacterium]
MALNLESKKSLVKEVSDVLNQAETVLTADYRGLTSNELNEFRKISRESDIYIKVVKNNMLKMALKDSEFSALGEKIMGPQILAVSKANLGDFAKLIKKFIDKHESIEIKSLAYRGSELDVSEIKKLASLPSYDEAISMLMSVMQAPVQKLLATINAIPTKIVRTLDAIKQSKN